MFEHKSILLYKFRLLVGAATIVVCLSLLSLLPPAPAFIGAASPSAGQKANVPARPRSGYSHDGPNVVSAGMADGLDSLSRTVDTAVASSASIIDAVPYGVYGGMRSAGITTVNSIKFVASTVARSAMFTANTIGAGGTLIANSMIDGILSAVRTAATVMGYFANVPPVRAVIRPADNYQVPIIESKLAAASLDRAALPEMETVSNAPASQPSPKPEPASAWPVRGRITTSFGVPHWPYQPIHTGIDISTGQTRGASPIKPFRAGRVTDTVYSRYGLGNHVVVDHGAGLSSVYAHLHSISVKVGQEVDNSTVLGFEGTTGVSTGTHLHFEIRLHGQPVNPQHYLSGHP